MNVKVLSIARSTKASVLASVRLELTLEGEAIVIDDARVLRNRAGQLWLAMPSYSVQLGGGRYDYQPAIVLSMGLKRAAEDAVLPHYEAWERNGRA